MITARRRADIAISGDRIAMISATPIHGARAARVIAATVADKATFTEPHQYPVGIEYVVVNGTLAVDGGRFSDVRAGRVLRRPGGKGRWR